MPLVLRTTDRRDHGLPGATLSTLQREAWRRAADYRGFTAADPQEMSGLFHRVLDSGGKVCRRTLSAVVFQALVEFSAEKIDDV